MHLHKLDRPLRRTRLSMNTSNQRIDALRQLMELEQRRSMLQTWRLTTRFLKRLSWWRERCA